MDKNDINRRAAAFASALQGPLGPMPLERVLRQHVELLTDLRQAGASWRQIAALMAHQGIRRKDGHPVDATQWAAMVFRIERARPAQQSGNQPLFRQIPAASMPPVARDPGVQAPDRLKVRARMRKAAAIRENE